MAGQFNASALPRRPGAYFNFVAQPAVLIPPATGAVVAVPFTNSWGPENTVVTLQSFSDYTSIYGIDLASPGYRANWQVFTGENVRGRRGAGAVRAYRMVGSAGAKAAVNLNNTTPAAALAVSAIYKGSVGNTLRITIRTNVADGTKRDFVVLQGSTEVESFTYDPTVGTPLAVLAASVNGVSDWVTVAVTVDTIALALVTSVPLTAGNDGSTLVAGDWTTMMTAMEQQRFGYLAPFDLTDPTIIASLKVWGQNANAKGRRMTIVVGGALDESVTTAVTRSGTLNDPDFCTVGVGSVRQLDLLDVNGNAVVLSTSQLVPRIAGIMSALGETRSLSGARLGGSVLLNGASEAGIDTAFDGGVIVLSNDSDPDSPVHIEKGLTTFTTKTDTARPYTIFREPKYIRTMHDLQDEISLWVEQNVIGQLQVNSKTRSAVVAEMSARMAVRETNGSIQSGWTVQVSGNPAPSDDQDFIALDYSLGFGRSVEKVLNTITVR